MKIQQQTNCVIIPKAFAHVVHKKILRHALNQKEPNFYGIPLGITLFIFLLNYILSLLVFRYSSCALIRLESSRMSHIFSK